jgi:D-inositol-3-phosphate glycosyltransferase
MNVYIVEVAKQLAELGVEVEIFTRATASDLPPSVSLVPGVLVRHVTAGPFEGLVKDDLPAQLCAFTAGVLRAEAQREPGWYDVIHSHYWLSGQVGWLARERWGVPLVHSAHTLAKVKNARLAAGDRPEPWSRVIGEEQVVAEADRLVASTRAEAAQLVELYHADPGQVEVIPPGVDLERFRPDSASTARTRLGIPPDALVLLFVGRIQPLKAPDILLRAAARLAVEQPGLRERLVVCVVGAPSGTGLAEPEGLRKLTGELGIGELVRFLPPMPAAELAGVYAAADLTVVPSYNESFGLVALESQACGTPVLAAAVGGLPTAVADGVSGVLVDGHDPAEYAAAIGRLVGRPADLELLAAGCRSHAERFSWRCTAERLIDTYRDALADPIFTPPERLAAQ